MSDVVDVESAHGEPSVKTSGALMTREVQFASSFVAPFAAAVAMELAELGLRDDKINQIMLSSAERFGAMPWEGVASEASNSPSPQAEENNEGAGVLQFFAAAFNGIGEVVMPFFAKHGPVVVDLLAEAVIEALHEALRRYASGSRSRK